MQFETLLIIGIMLSLVWFGAGIFIGFYTKKDEKLIGSLLIMDDEADMTRYLMLEFDSEEAKNNLKDGDIVTLNVENVKRE